MSNALLNQILVFTVLGSGLGIALWVMLGDSKKLVNKLFSCFVFLVVINIFVSYLFQLHIDSIYTIYWAKLIWVTASLMIPVFYYFAVYFPRKVKSYLPLNIIFILLGAIFSILSLWSDLLIKNISIKDWGNEISYGSLIYPFYAALIGSIIFGLWTILRKYILLSRIEKVKIKYFIFGIGIFLTANIVFGVIMPALFGNSEFTSLGDYSAIFFIGFTAYAIMRHQLFNIKVIATESIVILLSFGLLVETFISNSIGELIIKVIIWGLATYGGWQLIKSVKLEIQQKEELEHLAKKLEETNVHLKDLDRLKDDFLSMASHELNTPLAAIEGYLSMILEEGMGGGDNLSPQTREYLNRIFKASGRLSEIVKDLLNVSRIESGRIHLIYAEGQIEQIVKDAVNEIDPKLHEKNHTICMELPSEPLPVSWMDITRITEVVINFLGNAVKYTDDGGHIEIGAKEEDGNILVWVKDNGKGIPKDKSERVFQKFTQVDVLKDEVKGTGLGMYISQKFVELHKGKIWFESEGEGKGTVFYFSLPIVEKKPYDPNEGDGPVLR